MSDGKVVWSSAYWQRWGVVKLVDGRFAANPVRVSDGRTEFPSLDGQRAPYHGCQSTAEFATLEEAVEDAELRRDSRILAVRKTLRRLKAINFGEGGA